MVSAENRWREFQGRDVVEAIGAACAALGASQEELEIEVLEPGSNGIFGLCRKKACIRVRRRGAGDQAGQEKPAGARPADGATRDARPGDGDTPDTGAGSGSAASQAADGQDPEKRGAGGSSAGQQATGAQSAGRRPADRSHAAGTASGTGHGDPGRGGEESAAGEPSRDRKAQPPAGAGSADLDMVRAEVTQLLELMGMPSRVEVRVSDGSLVCTISGEHEEAIIGPNGRVLDSLQYLLRKMLGRRLPERCSMSLDVAGYRERRAAELRVLSLELAEKARESGRTQSIPALNPSERRAVHLALQDDPTVRSRSVGEGLFKKVLIYRPGKGRSSRGRRRRGSRRGESRD